MLVLADCLCGPLAPRRAARAYVLACVAASLCGIVTAVLSDRHRVVGPVTNVDTLAFFLIAALPLVGTVRTRVEQPVWPVWACFGVLLAAGVGTQSRAALVALVAMILLAVAHRTAGAALRRRPAGRRHDRRGARHRRAAAAHRPGPRRPGSLLRDQHRPAQRSASSRPSRWPRPARWSGSVPARSRCSTRTTARTTTTTASETSTPPTAPSSRPRPSSVCSASWRCTPCGWCRAPPPDDAGTRDRSRLTAGVLLALDGLLGRLGARVRALRPPAVVHGRDGTRAGPSRPCPHARSSEAGRTTGRLDRWWPDREFCGAASHIRRKPWPWRWCVLCATRGVLPHWGS